MSLSMDRTENLALRRVNGGIQIIQPENVPKAKKAENTLTVSQLLALPISAWFLDKSGATLAMNTEGVNICGFDSLQDALGHSIEAVSEAESARQLIHNCHEVIRLEQTRIYEETHIRSDGLSQQFLSVKSPLYDTRHSIIGICGFSIVLGRHPLAASLNLLAHLGLLDAPSAKNRPEPNQLRQLNLPPREKQCLELLLRGFTAKMIARQLALSFRTVESYLESLKRRLGASSKTELVNMFSA